MEYITKDKCWIKKEAVLEFKFGLTTKNIKECGKMIKHMVKGN